ncbi:unnamed protein product [Nezara viridula]|uniref:Protein adenylyltransferase Fic n=1 Tax=Nezara viridula TaxID=85310 RepID=A0A9P0E8L0_NEZVI|nr:unnamed protein product [Nezara viridula]
MGNLDLIKFYKSSRFKPAKLKALFCRVALTSSIFISIIAVLLCIVFNLTSIFVVNKNHSSLSDSRLQSAFLMQFPSQDVERYYDVEVTRKNHQHPSEYELEALQSLDAALEMLKLGKIERAQKLFEHALALSPKHPDVLNNYGEFMEYTQKDIIHADHLYFKAVTHSPGHSRAILNHRRLAELVEEMDLTTLRRIDKKRDSVASIPEANSALRKAKLEAYFQHIYHTVGIEGNTMTLSQTRSVVETKMAIGGKSIVEHNEILGLDAALKYINTTLINRIGHITVADILEIHRRVLGFVDPVEAGTLRRTQVFVGGHIPPPPSNIPPLMEQFEKWLNSWEAMRLHPVKYAAFAHYKLVYLHPFNDGNGRTSRLLMDTILMQAGYPPVIILKQDRHRYYQMIELANEGDIRPFIRYIAECTERTLDLFIWSTSEFSSELPALANEIKKSNHELRFSHDSLLSDKAIKQEL